MAEFAPESSTLLLLTSRSLPTEESLELTGGLPVRQVDSPANVGPSEPLLLVEASDRRALGDAAKASFSGSAVTPLVALAQAEAEGLAAVRAGASDWLPAGDRSALERMIRTCRARRARSLGGSVAAGAGSTSRRLAVEEHQRVLLDTRDASLRTVGLLLERRDLETKGHTDRVVAMALRLAEHLRLSQNDRQALRWGAYLHDIGKIALPDRILFKPGPLDDGEMVQVRRHTDIGCEMLSELPFLPATARGLVRHHHERWDGQGYPAGLAGPEIPLLARLFSVVDVFDALSSRRPYKPAWPRERVVAVVADGAGTTFDPVVAHAFLGLLKGAPARAAGPSPKAVTAPAE